MVLCWLILDGGNIFSILSMILCVCSVCSVADLQNIFFFFLGPEKDFNRFRFLPSARVSPIKEIKNKKQKHLYLYTTCHVCKMSSLKRPGGQPVDAKLSVTG